MRLYRCFPHSPRARRGRPGHWSYLPRPQRHGRWDNADLYDSWYLSATAVGAIAESFYNKRRWIPEVFLGPDGSPRAIAEFEFGGGELLDLDDAATLLRLGIRPSQVVVQDPAATQPIARRIHAAHGADRAGLSWWSSQLPSETSVLLWGAGGTPPPGLRLIGTHPLTLAHPSVIEAAARLYRPLD
jgi:hypothetical protein